NSKVKSRETVLVASVNQGTGVQKSSDLDRITADRCTLQGTISEPPHVVDVTQRETSKLRQRLLVLPKELRHLHFVTASGLGRQPIVGPPNTEISGEASSLPGFVRFISLLGGASRSLHAPNGPRRPPTGRVLLEDKAR